MDDNTLFLCGDLLGKAGLKAACLIFFDRVCFCRFIQRLVEEGNEFLRGIKIPAGNGEFQVFGDGAIGVGMANILLAAAGRLTKRFYG